jgi:hypothetical protein
MFATLLRAVTLTLVVGPPAIWLTTGPGTRAWWQDQLVIIAVSVLLGVLVILRRQGSGGVPVAAAFTVLMSALLFWFAFVTGYVEL